MPEDLTVNKEALEDFVEQRLSGDSNSSEDDPNGKYATENGFVKIETDWRHDLEFLYGIAKDNHEFLLENGHPVTSQNNTILELFGQEAHVIFQPRLERVPERRAGEAADLYLEAAEDSILLDPKLENIGVRPNSDRIEYFDTGERSSVRIPTDMSYGAVYSFDSQYEITFSSLAEAHRRGTRERTDVDFLEILRDRACQRYNEGHRLYPE